MIILCEKQCIASCGHREDIHNSSNNYVNFLAILKLSSETNSDLKHHLDEPSARNATYIYSRIQNELIEIISHDILQKDLVEELKEAKFFSLMADEVESHHTEQLPICLRFVDKEYNIREEFLEFSKCDQANGESVFKEIKCITEKNSLNIEFYRGQGYDGAANMSSQAVGVQKRVKDLCKKAVYTHCCGHNLSLVVVSACKIPVVHNVLEIVKEVTRLFVKVCLYCFNVSQNWSGRISKKILDKINQIIILETNVNQSKNTNSVISWIKQLQDKNRLSFVNFDVESFYPSITEFISGGN